MNAAQVSHALGKVNDKYIMEAITYERKKKSGWLKWGVMAACLLFVIVGIFATPHMTNSERIISNIDAEETYPEVPGSLAKIYNSLLEIVDDADVIAYVSVSSQSTETLDGYPQIHTLVAIQNIYKGDLIVGDMIEVIEASGQEGTVLGGIPVLNSEHEYILFLTEHNNSYYPVGAYQGRFILREGYLFQQATRDVKLESYSPLLFSDFENEIVSLIGISNKGSVPTECPDTTIAPGFGLDEPAESAEP